MYTLNPCLPKLRVRAVDMVRQGKGVREVARYFGVSPGAVSKWNKKAPLAGCRSIPTRSSRPLHHPGELPQGLVQKIIEQRKKRNRCSEVVHQELLNEGIIVSLSSVKRTLKRNYLLRVRSPWKRWHWSFPRPEAEKAGDMLEIDTIHVVPKFGTRFYVYTVIDVHSRWAYAKVSLKDNTHSSLRFLKLARKKASFDFKVVQSDHGSEFSSWFTEGVKVMGISHRHSRVRQANDNAHIERFNRTIQEECLDSIIPFPLLYQKAIKEYLPYYNNERLHLGINLKTPIEIISKCFQGID